MENKSRMDSILSDIHELEHLLKIVQNEEVYPVAFFSKSFDLAHHLLKDLHLLEGEQIEKLQKQMEEYRKMIGTVSITPEESDISTPDDAEPVVPVIEIPDVTINRQSAILNDIINRKNFSDLRKAFSLNDRFYYQKELFGGDESKMNDALTALNGMDSYDKSLAYVREELKLDESNAIVTEFISIIEKHFH